jgi:hypothetical protein
MMTLPGVIDPPPYAFCPWVDGDSFVDEYSWIDPWHGTGLVGSAYYAVRNTHIPLIVAAQENNLHQVKRAIADGTNVNAVGLDGETALHMAAALGHTEIIVLLLAAHAAVDASTHDGSTPLVHCALFCPRYISAAVADLLLSAGANPMKMVTHDLTPLPPLCYAIRSNNLSLVKCLALLTDLSYIASPGRTSSEPVRESLTLAEITGDITIFDFLLSCGMPIQSGALFHAGHPATFDAVIGAASVKKEELQKLAPQLLYSARSFRSSSALIAASNSFSFPNSKLTILAEQLFRKYNINPNAENLRTAVVSCGDVNVVHLAIRHGFDITALSDSEICCSLRNKPAQFVSMIQQIRVGR